MPTPKFTPGAQLIPLSLTAPAFFGLNTELGATILGREWATVLDNAVFDDAGRPAARKGFASLTSSAASALFMRVFEYYKADGTSELIASTDDDIYDTLSGTPVSIDGALTITEGNIKFVNFNDKVIGFGIGTGGIPAVRTTGDFADITVNSGTAPTSGIGTSAFGRLWAVDTDGKTLRYSALLDETRWAAADGGGSIDFSKVWPSGQDDIVAVTEFGGDLVVFGSRNTVVMTDGVAADLGIDPLSLYVSDTIPGMGCVSQFAITKADGDLWVCTYSGVVGLSRELVQRSTPHTNIGKNVQSLIVSLVQNQTDLDDITLEYDPVRNFVLCVFPQAEKVVCFDTRGKLQDGSYRATTWTMKLQTVHYEKDAQRLIGSLTAVVGEIMNYTGSQDDGGNFIWDYESGWLDLGEELNVFLKFVKRMTSFVFVEQNVEVTHKVDYDFGTGEFTTVMQATGGQSIEWGQFEWSDGSTATTGGKYDVDDPNAVAGTDIAEWAGGVQLRTMEAAQRGGGQYIKVGLTLNTAAGDFSLQQINLYAKVGRMAS